MVGSLSSIGFYSATLIGSLKDCKNDPEKSRCLHNFLYYSIRFDNFILRG